MRVFKKCCFLHSSRYFDFQKSFWIITQELATTFNCGIGMVLVVAAELVDDVMKTLKDHQEEAYRIGELKVRILKTKKQIVIKRYAVSLL